MIRCTIITKDPHGHDHDDENKRVSCQDYKFKLEQPQTVSVRHPQKGLAQEFCIHPLKSN